MANYNKVILAGNLTRDPTLKYLPNNTAVCEFGLAINRRWRDPAGQQREDTCFVDVAAFGRQGETINQYMSKGRGILIEGRLKFDSWQAQDGSKRSKLSVVAETFQFLGDRGGGPAPAGGREARPAAARTPDRAGAADSGSAQHESSPAHEEGYAPSNEDIPF